MWPFKKNEEPKAPERKDTVIQVDPLRISTGPMPEQLQKAALNPNQNDFMIDAIKQSIARAEKKGEGDHPVVQNLRDELVWREKIAKAGV